MAQGRWLAAREKWDVFCMLPPNELVSGPALVRAFWSQEGGLRLRGIAYTEPL